LTKVGRNDPCPCGSGKKYKKCCMLKDERQSSIEQMDNEPVEQEESSERNYNPARVAEIDNAFRRAINHLDRGDFNKAASAFRSVLRLDSKHYKALTGLGRCLKELGMYEEARVFFEKALEINPEYAQARVNLELMK